MNLREAGIAAARAAMECIRGGVWDRVGDGIFAIDLGDGTLLGASVWRSGGEPTIAFTRGPDALREIRRLHSGEAGFEGVACEQLAVVAVPRRTIHKPFSTPVLEARIDEPIAPAMMWRRPGKQWARPRAQDYELLARALGALSITAVAGRLDSFEDPGSPRVVVLEVSGEIDALQVSVALRNAGREGEPAKGPALTPLAELPRLDKRYAIDILTDGLPAALAVVIDLDQEPGTLLDMFGLEPGESRVRNSRFFLQMMLRSGGSVQAAEPGLPAELHIGDLELFEAVEQEFRDLGVACVHTPALEAFELVRAAFLENLASVDADGDWDDGDWDDEEWDDEGFDEEDQDDDEALAEALVIDEDLIDHVLVPAFHAARDNDKAWRRYLGVDRPRRDELVDRFGDGLLQAYADWFAHVHRGGKKSRTIAERCAVHPDLDEDVRVAAASLARATGSFYRVGTVDADGRVEITDVLSGDVCWIADPMLARTARSGVVMPLRVYSVGPLDRILPFGPNLVAAEVEPALAHLASLGMPLDEPIGPEHWHLVGRLWDWVAQRVQAGPPRMQNHDGEPLRLLRGRYRVGDAEALVATLEAHPEVHETERGERWSWGRNGDGAAEA